MRLLADENIPLPSVHLLRQAGHDVEAVAEFAPGAEGPRVLAYAEDHDLVMVTYHRDFGSDHSADFGNRHMTLLTQE